MCRSGNKMPKQKEMQNVNFKNKISTISMYYYYVYNMNKIFCLNKVQQS